MNIDLSNPGYAEKLNELGFEYSHTDHDRDVIVYVHEDPQFTGTTYSDMWKDMECVIDFADANGMDPLSFTFKNLRNGVSQTIQADYLCKVDKVCR